eukprot:3430598-Amphidinium_carterae.1
MRYPMGTCKAGRVAFFLDYNSDTPLYIATLLSSIQQARPSYNTHINALDQGIVFSIVLASHSQ